jgi:hypothetical protein
MCAFGDRTIRRLCNVCTESLPSRRKSLVCEVCKIRIHKTCAAKLVHDCKWTTAATVPSVAPSAGSLAHWPGILYHNPHRPAKPKLLVHVWVRVCVCVRVCGCGCVGAGVGAGVYVWVRMLRDAGSTFVMLRQPLS